ncbi:hypothetical protein [Spiroplasma endosymbiont of Megaselia nigra]|uniref:hypothetical protein n=1 Tax=Spiroplasma endosymbiont of Megaselia nigra TaxID=2478537 RepID=UPI000F85C9DF|nr:hypothetical protein [Spiroplasma endosymbiont of Megaselia nigra]
MMLLSNAGSNSLQEIGNKIISVGMPILMGLAVTIGIVMVAYYGVLLVNLPKTPNNEEKQFLA